MERLLKSEWTFIPGKIFVIWNYFFFLPLPFTTPTHPDERILFCKSLKKCRKAMTVIYTCSDQHSLLWQGLWSFRHIYKEFHSKIEWSPCSLFFINKYFKKISQHKINMVIEMLNYLVLNQCKSCSGVLEARL